MTMVSDPRDEALVSIARNMATQGGRRRSERVIYYRSPATKVDGSPYQQAHWICWGDTNDQAQLQKLRRGFIPLPQYGNIEGKRRDEDPDGPFEMYGPWGAILSSQAGMQELPAEQIVEYHWYDEQRLRASLHGNIPPTLQVKNGIVMWPQLQGREIKVYTCPECANMRYIIPVHLARHLRVWHEYDRQDVIAFCTENGIDLSARVDGSNKVVSSFIFEDTKLDQEEVPEGSVEDFGFSVSVAQPVKRGPGRPPKEQGNESIREF